jgi:REP element-mobilizing transposase RayT
MMSNHFHLLLRVPAASVLTDEELVARLTAFYGEKSAKVALARQSIKDQGKIDETMRQSILSRMGDVSVFMKEFKQQFSRWYNHQHERFGTLWAERFKCVLVEEQPAAMEAVSAYIDLNPVRAGLVEDPKDYRFCGYASALTGNKQLQSSILSFQKEKKWQEAAKAYRMRLLVGAGASGNSGKAVLDRVKIKAVLDKGGELSFGETMMLRIRHMSDGVAIGSKEFVNEVFVQYRDRFGKNRKEGARPIRVLAKLGLKALRDLKVNAVG